MRICNINNSNDRKYNAQGSYFSAIFTVVSCRYKNQTTIRFFHLSSCLFESLSCFPIFSLLIPPLHRRQMVKGLIAQVSIVCEFTDSLVPTLQNSASQSAKLNPASGEMFLARSHGVRFLLVRTEETWLPKMCTLLLTCANVYK